MTKNKFALYIHIIYLLLVLQYLFCSFSFMLCSFDPLLYFWLRYLYEILICTSISAFCYYSCNIYFVIFFQVVLIWSFIILLFEKFIWNFNLYIHIIFLLLVLQYLFVIFLSGCTHLVLYYIIV